MGRADRWLRWVVITTVVMVVASGCSSGTADDSADTTATTSDESSQATASPATETSDESAADSEADSGAEDSTGFGLDPCSLLTAEEISTATGLEFGAGAINDTVSTDLQGACDWITTGSEFAIAQVLIAQGSDVLDTTLELATLAAGRAQ